MKSLRQGEYSGDVKAKKDCDQGSFCVYHFGFRKLSLFTVMLKNYDAAIMKAVALCIKPYLKPEEAMIYCNLGRTRLAIKCEEYGIYKNINGYYKRDDLDLILSGAPSKLEEKIKNLQVSRRRR